MKIRWSALSFKTKLLTMNLSTLLLLATGAGISFWRLSDDLEKEKYSGLELQRS